MSPKRGQQEDRRLLSNQRLQQLIKAIQDLAQARDLESIMNVVCSAARGLVSADGATFVLREGDQCFYADENAIRPLWKGERFPMSLCISGWVMMNQQPAVVEDIYADARIPASAYRPTFVKSLVMVPIRSQNPLGAIGNYWAQPHSPTPEEVQLLQSLADATAIAMENVRLFDEQKQRLVERELAEHALLQNEQLLSESQRIAHIGGWSWDLKGAINWTPETYRIYGVSPETFTPTVESLVKVVHLEDRPAMRRWIEACAAGAKPDDLEFRTLLADGTVRFLSGRGELQYDAENRPTYMAGTVQDITERKRLEHALFESETLCKSVFERVPLGVIMLRPDGRFSMTNPAWIRMIGYSAEELKQMTVLDVAHPDDRAESLRFMASSNAGNLDELVFDKRYVRKNGEVFWARVNGAALRDSQGAITGRVAIIEDNTEEREAELRRAEQRRLQRDALVRDVHHRIKNHLQGVAGLLERHAVDNRVLEPVAAQLLGQLNVLATVHGLQSESSDRQLNLCNIVRNIVESLQVTSTARLDVALPQESVPIEVNAEEAVPIALILNELISNAIKHLAPSVERGAVKIELKWDGVRALVAVRNQPGSLPPGFDFANSRTLGTGLRLVKSLLPGEGAKLIFSQPAAEVVESVLELWPPILSSVGDA